MAKIVDGILFLDQPTEVDLGTWTDEHIDCDSFIIKNDDPMKLTVVAVSTDKKYNHNLEKLRNQYKGGILRGLTSQEVNTIV